MFKNMIEDVKKYWASQSAEDRERQEKLKMEVYELTVKTRNAYYDFLHEIANFYFWDGRASEIKSDLGLTEEEFNKFRQLDSNSFDIKKIQEMKEHFEKAKAEHVLNAQKKLLEKNY